MINRAGALDIRRLLLVFDEQSSDELQRLVEAIGRARCRIADRDLDVYLVGDVEVTALSDRARVPKGDSAARLRKLRGSDGSGSGSGSGFELVLVGKDGGVKARTHEAASLVDLLKLIDGMPMRRAEVARRGSDREGMR